MKKKKEKKKNKEGRHFTDFETVLFARWLHSFLPSSQNKVHRLIFIFMFDWPYKATVTWEW